MNTIKERRKLYIKWDTTNEMNDFRKKIKIGSGNVGNVYKSCKIDDQCIAIKKMYLDRRESRWSDDIFNFKALKYGAYIELVTFKLINQLILQGICPHFVLNYDYEILDRDSCDDYPKKMLLYNEYSEIMLYNEWVRSERNINEWYNIYFQIIISLYSLNKYFNMTHFDLHLKNIFIKKVKRGGYWKYIINDNTYYLPNLGFICYINDFDQVWIPDILRGDFSKYANKKNIKKSYDIYFLWKSGKDISTSPIRHILKKLSKDINENGYEQTIEEVWGEKYYKRPVSKLIETYKFKKLDKSDLDPILRKLTRY